MPYYHYLSSISNSFSEAFSAFKCKLEDVLDMLLALQFDRTVIVLISMIIAGFISITIPLALNIVSGYTKEYKDKEIAESFLKERTYRYQVYWILPQIVLTIIILSLKVESGWWIYAMILSDCISITVFIFFIRVMQQYSTNFDEYYSNKLKKEADDILQS